MGGVFEVKLMIPDEVFLAPKKSPDAMGLPFGVSSERLVTPANAVDP
jgi:hypothetical protein